MKERRYRKEDLQPLEAVEGQLEGRNALSEAYNIV